MQSGKYPALPKVYSQDLVQVLSAMIKVNPRERPTAAQLLDMPAVALRRKSDWFTKLPSHEVVGDVQMQGTIKVCAHTRTNEPARKLTEINECGCPVSQSLLLAFVLFLPSWVYFLPCMRNYYTPAVGSNTSSSSFARCLSSSTDSRPICRSRVTRKRGPILRKRGPRPTATAAMRLKPKRKTH